MAEIGYRKPVPGGIEFFQKLRRGNYYYVDKTPLIAGLLRNTWEVTLFTRPRRFGKTLMLDTIRSFFEIGADPEDFSGLAIAEETELCQRHLGQYPVIFLTLKSVEGRDYPYALDQFRYVIQREVSRNCKNLDRNALDAEWKAKLEILQDRNISELDMQNSLLMLSELLSVYYDKPTVILIDEYDVPLDKAYHAEHPYYKEMVSFLRSFLGGALKTNPHLHFAVLTGCLRIAKESIFTGLNNFRMITVSKQEFADSFGFTELEVRAMLDYYGLGNYYDTVQDWYDGYRFGDRKVFCPWDVINYIADCQYHPGYPPQNYWINSSGNEIIHRLVHSAGPAVRKDLECLLAGEAIYKPVREELTYEEIYSSAENIWSVMYVTGYLTQGGERLENGILPLVLPNREVRQIFEQQVWEWFRADSKKDPVQLSALCQAFLDGNAAEAETRFGAYLRKMVSIRDTASRSGIKENFYHGLLLGLLSAGRDWVVRSNPESGIGYADLLVEDEETDTALVLELKYAHDGNLDLAAESALAQIQAKSYDSILIAEGFSIIRHCGIGCYQKRCRIRMAQGETEGGGTVLS